MSRTFEDPEIKLFVCLPLIGLLTILGLFYFGDIDPKLKTAKELTNASYCQNYHPDELRSCRTYRYNALISAKDFQRITFTWSPDGLNGGAPKSCEMLLDFKIYSQLKSERSTSITIWRDQIIWVSTRNGEIATNKNPLIAAVKTITAIELVLAITYCGLLLLLECKLGLRKNSGAAICIAGLMVVLSSCLVLKEGQSLKLYFMTGAIDFGMMLAAVAVDLRARGRA